MSINRDTIIEIEGCNGDWATIAGPDAGDENFVLATGVVGLYEPPVKVVYEEPGNYPGARYLSHRILRRDITFGVWILDEDDQSWITGDSRWRKMWAFDKDTKIHVTTPDSGRRSLSCRLGQSIEVDLTDDPSLGSINLAKMTVIAGDPFWYGDDAVFSAVTTTDTTFNPLDFVFPWSVLSVLPNEDLTISVTSSEGGVNPTDQPVFPKWTVPGSTTPPALPYIPFLPWLGAPESAATIWTVPDYSFGDTSQDPGLQFETRRLRMPSLIGGLETNEVQTIEIDGRPTGGTFTITFSGQTTSALAYNASASTVQAALIALSNIALGDVSVALAPKTNEVQEYHLTGGPTGGTYTLTYSGQTTAGIPPYASASAVRTALANLSNLALTDISVSAVQTNEVQTVTVTGEPTGGTFTLTFDGQTTSGIAWNASASTVKAALVALSNVGTNDVSVTQPTAAPDSEWDITFQTNLGGINLGLMTADASSLTGGAGMAIAVAEKTAGGSTYTITFSGSAVAGIDQPQITGTVTSLTGGSSPAIVTSTDVQGARPWVVTFLNNFAGVDVPLMTVATGSLTGGTSVSATVVATTEGATQPAEDAVIDTDPRVEQVSSASGSPLWARMNGVRFRNFIPPWTEEKDFVVSVAGAAIGQMVTLRIPRPWSRPWGLE